MARRSDELQQQCILYGLEAHGTREQMQDRLRDFFIKRDNLNVLPQVQVMTAQNGKDWLDYDLEKPWRSPRFIEMWKSKDWVVEPKLDGCRVKAHFHERYSIQPRLDSRRRSDTNFIFAEQSQNFPHLALTTPPPDTILDGELMPPPGIRKIWNGVMFVEDLQIVTSIWNSGKDTSLNLQQYCYPVPDGGYWQDEELRSRGCLLQYNAFDIIRYNGEWLHDHPYDYRRALLRDVMGLIMEQNQSYKIVPEWHVDNGWCQEGLLEWDDSELGRLDEFEQLISRGGEGVMFKYLKSPYEYNKRSWSWVKLKKFTEASMFIVGAVPSTPGKGWENYIGAFEVAVMQAGIPVHVASCSAMPLDMRKDATGPDKTLNPAYLNKVVEVRYQVMTTRSVRGRHAVISRWRPDQTPEDCLYEQLTEQPSEIMDQ